MAIKNHPLNDHQAAFFHDLLVQQTVLQARLESALQATALACGATGGRASLSPDGKSLIEEQQEKKAE